MSSPKNRKPHTPTRGARISRDKLVALRQSKAWTQQRLADESEIPLNTIKRWESRSSSSPVVDFESAARLAAPFEMTAPELLQILKPDAVVNTYVLPEQQAEALTRYAESRGLTLDDIVQEALQDVIRHKIDPQPPTSRKKTRPA